MKSAIAFLTTEPQEQTITFAYKIQRELSVRENIDVFIICDTELFITYKDGPVKIIQIKDEDCKKAGYQNATQGTHIQKNPNAIDKFFYFFCELRQEYDYISLFEDDVFIPSVDAIRNFRYNEYDLVVSKHVKKTDDILDWNWAYVLGKIDKPWYRTMLCAAGMSRRMLNCVREYVEKNKTLINSEVILNTLAAHNNLKIYTPFELRSIVWQGEWGIDDVLKLPNNFFHPVKDFKRQEMLRLMVDVAKTEGYEPANKLPNFLKELC